MNRVYKFAEFVLDKHAITFYRRNVPVQLSSRAFEMLLYLIEKRGEVVEKDALLNRVWKDAFVEEANLAVHISALRRVLEEKKGETRFIRTVSGRGYSFIADVEVVEERRAKGTELPAVGADDLKTVSIAVLPLSIKSTTSDIEYLANGVTQSLIGDLSRRSDLRVLSYSAVKAYKDSEMELQEIAFLLDVDKILTGAISQVRRQWEISVELVNVADKRCLWATTQTFRADDIFEVKKEISSAIAEKLKLTLQIGRMPEAKEINSEAQKLYYRGRFILEARGTRRHPEQILNQALKFFKDAIECEPNYALAYTGIGSVYVSLHNHNLLSRDKAYSEAKAALRFALKADPCLSEAHVLEASIGVMFDLSFREAQKSVDRAIALDPNNADAHHWNSLISLFSGNFAAALEEEEKAVKLDPTSSRFNESLLRIFFLSGDFNKVIVLAEELLEFDGNLLTSHLFSALSYAHLGLFDRAFESIDRALGVRDFPDIMLHKAYIFALSGRALEAENLLKFTLEGYAVEEVDKVDTAAVCTVLGQADKAFEYLELAIINRSSGLTSLRIDPRFRTLWPDHRFSDLLARLNLV